MPEATAKDFLRGPVSYHPTSQDNPMTKAVLAQQASEYKQAVLANPNATVEELLAIGMSWQDIMAQGKLGPFRDVDKAYENYAKNNPLIAKQYPLKTQELPPSPQKQQGPIEPVRGTNENGEETITFTAQGMKRFLTLMNPAQDGRLSGIDPNSNIGTNPYAMKAPMTPEQAAQADPVQTLRMNANATPLPNDVLAQLRMDEQVRQQQQTGGGSGKPSLMQGR